MKSLNKKEFQQIAVNHSSGIVFKDLKEFKEIYKNVLQNHIFSYSTMIRLYHRMIHYNLEKIF